MKLFIQNLSILSLVATCYATSFWNRSDSSDSDDDVPYQGNIQGDMFFNRGTHVFGSTQKTNGRGGTQESITRSITATGGASVTIRNEQTNMTQGNSASNVPRRPDNPQSANTRGATASGSIYGGNGTSIQSVNVGKVSADSGSKINVDPTQRFFGGGRGIQTTSIQSVQGPPDSININPVVKNN